MLTSTGLSETITTAAALAAVVTFLVRMPDLLTLIGG